MAYAGISSCDLCDAVASGADAQGPRRVEIRIAPNAHIFAEKEAEAVLCVRCAEPLVALAGAIKERGEKSATERLNERVLAALADGKI